MADKASPRFAFVFPTQGLEFGVRTMVGGLGFGGEVRGDGAPSQASESLRTNTTTFTISDPPLLSIHRSPPTPTLREGRNGVREQPSLDPTNIMKESGLPRLSLRCIATPALPLGEGWGGRWMVLGLLVEKRGQRAAIPQAHQMDQ